MAIDVAEGGRARRISQDDPQTPSASKPSPAESPDQVGQDQPPAGPLTTSGQSPAPRSAGALVGLRVAGRRGSDAGPRPASTARLGGGVIEVGRQDRPDRPPEVDPGEGIERGQGEQGQRREQADPGPAPTAGRLPALDHRQHDQSAIAVAARVASSRAAPNRSTKSAIRKAPDDRSRVGAKSTHSASAAARRAPDPIVGLPLGLVDHRAEPVEFGGLGGLVSSRATIIRSIAPSKTRSTNRLVSSRIVRSDDFLGM